MNDPNVQQVGYNTGRGAMQNRNFGHQIVGRAVPSHGGQLPGGIPLEAAGFTGIPSPPTAGGFGMHGGFGAGMPPGYCPPGAAPGAGGPGAAMGGMPGVPLAPGYAMGRSQIRFVSPPGMKIAWQSFDPVTGAAFTPQLEVPARYNFVQGRIYRLKVYDIAQRPGLELYPTLEVYPGNGKVDAFLAHNAIPIEFTPEDFDQVQAGNYVTKVIYLPDPKYQDLAIAGVETLVSTRLDPGSDPVKEANRRGQILAVVRIGSVDLEMPHSPALYPQPPVMMQSDATNVIVTPGPEASTQSSSTGSSTLAVAPNSSQGLAPETGKTEPAIAPNLKPAPGK